MLFKIFAVFWKTRLSEKQASRVENRSHKLFSIVKCCEITKWNNAQNDYSSADNTGKIKKSFIFQFQAFLIAFTSEFIPKLVYKYEHSWNMQGYVNFTLATSPYAGWASEGKTECRYRAFRDHEGSFTPSHYKILGLKLAFVIIFEVSCN